VQIGRKSLPHDLPLWVDIDGAVFFITCCAKQRESRPFACEKIATGLLESIRHRIQTRIWWVHAATVMPDHVHLVLGFPPETDVVKCIRDWKRWTARVLGFDWQRDFFEHRLRHDESFQEKVQYVLENPVRAGLVEDWRDWRFTLLPEG
jgi:REP element-mobilizing transposase RayT